MNRLLNFGRSRWARNAAALCLVVVFALTFLGQVGAQAALIQGYKADETLERGRVVVIDDKDASKVKVATIKDDDKVYGVVVDPNDAPVTLTSQDQKVFVATAGRYQVLVSTENGIINVGDYVSISTNDGIAAKTSTRNAIVLGKAMQGFDGKSLSITKTKDGKAAIGRIVVDINIGKNPNKRNEIANLPDFLKRTGEALAGKPINPIRIYMSVFVFLVSATVSGVVLYAGIKSALISMGRNPLGKKSIVKGLMQVVVGSLIILISGMFGVYLLLRI